MLQPAGALRRSHSVGPAIIRAWLFRRSEGWLGAQGRCAAAGQLRPDMRGLGWWMRNAARSSRRGVEYVTQCKRRPCSMGGALRLGYEPPTVWMLPSGRAGGGVIRAPRCSALLFLQLDVFPGTVSGFYNVRTAGSDIWPMSGAWDSVPISVQNTRLLALPPGLIYCAVIIAPGAGVRRSLENNFLDALAGGGVRGR